MDNFEQQSGAPQAISNIDKVKWMLVGVALTLLFVAVVAITYFLFKQENIGTLSQQQEVIQEQVIVEDPQEEGEPVSEVKSDWVISLPDQELTSTVPLEKSDLVYAIKEDTKVTVFARKTLTGSQAKLFEYDEPKVADKGGNLWAGLPPNIALSPDKKTLAYIDQGGLQAFDLKTESSQVVIGKVQQLAFTDAPPSWSIEGLFAYSLHRPLWSSDGQNISFLQSYTEGAGFGVINFDSGEYTSLSIGGGYRNLAWGPTGHSIVKGSAGAYEGIGLFFTSSDLTSIVDISGKFVKEGTSFFEANFSPDEKKLVFSYRDNFESDEVKVGIVNTDGSGFQSIDEGNIQMPFFSPSGDAVLFVKELGGAQFLLSYDLDQEKSTVMATLPETYNRWVEASWTEEGFLAVTARSSSSGLVVGGDSARLVLLDLENSEIVYASSVYEQFVNFVGFKE